MVRFRRSRRPHPRGIIKWVIALGAVGCFSYWGFARIAAASSSRFFSCTGRYWILRSSPLSAPLHVSCPNTFCSYLLRVPHARLVPRLSAHAAPDHADAVAPTHEQEAPSAAAPLRRQRNPLLCISFGKWVGYKARSRSGTTVHLAFNKSLILDALQ